MTTSRPTQASTPIPGNLTDTLDRLRRLLERLGNTPGSGIAGGPSSGLGGTSSGIGASSFGAGTSSLGQAAALAMATQLQRTMAATAAAFDASMAQTTRAWRSGLASAQTQMVGAVGHVQAAFQRAASHSAKGFEKAFDASIGLGIHAIGRGVGFGAGVARRAWADPGGFATAMAGGARGFVGDFASGWRNNQPGGIPVGGVGAVWGQAAASHWNAFGRRVHRARTQARWAGRQAGRRYTAARAAGKGRARAAAAAASGFLPRNLALGLSSAAPIIGGLAVSAIELGALSVRKAIASARGDMAEEILAGNRHLARYNGVVSNSFMALDTAQHGRDVDLAKRTQGSSATLATAVNHMRDNWQEGNVFFQEATNRIGIIAASFASEIGKALVPGFKAGNGLLAQLDPNGVNSGALGAAAGAFLGSVFTDPGNFNMLNPFGPATAKGKAAAAAQAQALANPPRVENPAGQALHDMTMRRGGPIVRRPAPIR